jgi:hypothetical protein
MTTMNQPSFNVYLNRKGGEFVVSRQFEDEHGLHCDTGPFLRFDPESMRQEGLRFTEEHFIAFQSRTSNEPSEFQQMSTEEKNQFHRAHKNVWVYRSSANEVVLWPMRLAKRAELMVPVALEPEDCVRLSWPTTPSKFFDSLMAAFDNAH